MRLTCLECGAGLDQTCGCDSKPDPLPEPVRTAPQIIEGIIKGFHRTGHISADKRDRILSILRD